MKKTKQTKQKKANGLHKPWLVSGCFLVESVSGQHQLCHPHWKIHRHISGNFSLKLPFNSLVSCFWISYFFNQILSLCLRGRILQFKLYPNMGMHFVYTFLFMFPKVMIKRLFENQELLKLMIISFILKTFKFDSRMILWGEIRHPSKG